MANIQKSQRNAELTPRAYERDGDRYPDYKYLKARGNIYDTL